MKILYNFASRSRPERFFKRLDEITTLARHADYQIVGTLDIDDESMNNQDIWNKINAYSKLTAVWGTSKSKIDAINKNVYIGREWDILINVSDDLSFKKECFDLDIISDFEKYGLDTLMHYPDGHVNERLITQAIMGRIYYDRFGYIYHPDFLSVYADNEMHLVGDRLGKRKFIDRKLFVHEHPIWDKAYGEPDALLKHTESFYPQDSATYNRRLLANFPTTWNQ
jgi:hypothetical protein